MKMKSGKHQNDDTCLGVGFQRAYTVLRGQGDAIVMCALAGGSASSVALGNFQSLYTRGGMMRQLSMLKGGKLANPLSKAFDVWHLLIS